MPTTSRPHLFALLLAALLPLAGCGAEADPEARGGETDARPVVGVSIPAATHGWPAGVGWWAEQAMAEYPDIDWQFQRASRATDQASQVETMVQQGLDALVILPFDSDTPLSAVRRAKDRDVYVVSVDRGLRQPIADLYVAGDNRAFGRISAEYMVERLNFQGNIVILRGMQVEIDEERYQAAMEVFNAHPGIEVLDAQHGNWNRKDALEVMQTFLTKHDDIDAVWASDDDMALGVEQALRETGRTDEMWILGGAGMKDIVQRVMEGDDLYPADVTYPPAMIAAGIHLAAAQVLHDGDEQAVAENIPAHLGLNTADLHGPGESTGDEQRNLTLPVHLVTPDNAEDYYFPDSVY
ncbi:MAG: ABC transporter substrate-binding protein [Phycisphaeraceae bacterium]